MLWGVSRFQLHTHITHIKSLFESCNRVALRNELLSKVALVASFENSADDGRIVQLLRIVKLVTTRVASRVIVRKIRVMLAPVKTLLNGKPSIGRDDGQPVLLDQWPVFRLHQLNALVPNAGCCTH